MNWRTMGSVGDVIVHAIERHGERIAFECDGACITYAQLGRDVARTIKFLEENGIKTGDRIAQISANRYEMFVVIAAAYVGGYISLALQYNADRDEQKFAMEDCKPAILVVDEGRLPRAMELKEVCDHKFIAAVHNDIGIGSQDTDNSIPPIGSFVGRTDPEKCARINYTGGTSGKPKAVMISSAALTYTNLTHVGANALDSATRFLVSSPISHGAGSFITPVLSKGGRVIIHDRFNPAAAIASVIASQVNTLFVVPTMLYALLDHPDAAQIKPGQLRRIIYGAAPASPSRVRQAIEMFGPVLVQSYGQSEAPGTILYLSDEDHLHDDPERLASAGRPYPGVSIKLLRSGSEIPYGSGEVGELCVRAPHVMMGYWQAPELTAEVFEGGWLHTGDLACIDRHGFFHIVDRVKDMIISGGFNVYASEVEQSLDAHPAVKASAVIGVPDAKWGEAVKAFVVKNNAEDVTAEALIAFVRDQKGAIKTPKTIEFVADLPVTKVGKVDKKQLRSGYWKDSKRSVN